MVKKSSPRCSKVENPAKPPAKPHSLTLPNPHQKPRAKTAQFQRVLSSTRKPAGSARLITRQSLRFLCHLPLSLSQLPPRTQFSVLSRTTTPLGWTTYLACLPAIFSFLSLSSLRFQYSSDERLRIFISKATNPSSRIIFNTYKYYYHKLAR